MKVNAITCNNCNQTIYSRAVHDFRTCQCFHNEVGNTGIAVDGGRSYFKYLYGDNSDYKVVEVEVDLTEQELYDDWNLRTDQFGIIEDS